jgi:mutator protein MutT
MGRFLTYTAVYAVLEREGKIYLMRRANTGYMDGFYGTPGGHVEEGESLIEATVREVREEAGIEVDLAETEFVHVDYRRKGDRTYNDYFFRCNKWQGEPQAMEADKCDDAGWFDLGDLPDNMVPELKQALSCIARGVAFSELDLR